MLDRKLSPDYYPPEFNNILLPDKAKLASGIQVYTFKDNKQKVFKIELNFPFGSTNDSNPAVASICLAMLHEGTSSKSAVEINNLLDFYGAFLDLKSSLESITIGLYGRTVYFKELIILLADIVVNPLFKESSLIKQKHKAQQKLAIDQEKTSYWSSRLLRQNIFGAQHAYSRLITDEDFGTLTRNDLVEYHKNFLLPGLQFIIIAGSMPNNCGYLLQKYFCNVGYTKKSIKKYGSYRPESEKIVIKRLPNANQASIALGIDAISLKEDHYAEYAFITKVLGGYFGSRLMKKIREEEGLTYGIHAYNIHLKAGSYLQIMADIELSAVDKGIDMIFTELEKLIAKGILEDELNTVKHFMLGEFVNDSNTTFDFADLYKKLLIYELPENYYEKFYGNISRLNTKYLSAYLPDIWRQENFSIVKVL